MNILIQDARDKSVSKSDEANINGQFRMLGNEEHSLLNPLAPNDPYSGLPHR